MTNSITPSTYVRSLGYGMMRQLADFIDPQEGWKKLAADITDSSGAKQYNQMQIRRFEALKQVGKSPTCELLYDWGTLNCTVSDLVDLLIRNQFLAPASLLIPDSVSMRKNMTLSLSLPETVLLHKKGPLVEGKKISELPSLDPNEGHLTSNSCDPSSENSSSHLNDTGLKSFLFYELKSITNNFDDQTLSAGGNKIGEGGFGVVYKGCINGQTVAVKKLTALADVSIKDLKKQFEQEIKIMARCQHENLVELLGFSNDFDQPCLVYDYMPKGSLLDRLACLDNTSPIPWETRCNIAYGTSNGISFLHENNHIHRDVKSANILLTETFVPKLSDFGLARTSVRFTHTILTDRIVGTAAYMAPEALRGEITPKSDIFSFGVVLLEIITGLSPMDENQDPQLLLSIKEEIEDEEKTIGHYVDKKISNRNITSIEQMYSIASQCLHEKKNRRPDIERVKEHLKEMLIE
ncbi:interleukin-1 receptor-associated kinase 3 isoform X1 [Protobothrops mucrosquamatus]|uniref:interleukin-1 receptor-associated kinase 3 isoform X1 n=1 Tax=Protobothrops mucrosquamatus TaxID=103944 RepID=UPI000775637A|nr:interleukin-1 receptor-associated kinase 3 isoform X1 [Protobothrops mucrosquamatus]XP_015667940.1 interleukin-1 receptor-associated kinase 3 isoform X1 [Protobothrops mucrosquamatus]